MKIIFDLMDDVMMNKCVLREDIYVIFPKTLIKTIMKA
jgi:hypothetical protein